jgi:hypothetical protein
MVESDELTEEQQRGMVEALASTDKRVRFAAADGLVRGTRGAAVPSARAVVAALAEAVTEEKVNTIYVIAPESLKGEVAVANATRGGVFLWDSSAIGAINALLSNPSTDVVVINEILPDRMPEDVMGILAKDGRFGHTKFVILTKDEDAASERFGDEVGYLSAPASAESLQAAVAEALDGVEDADGAQREEYASKASKALLSLATREADIGAAVANLALQLNRGDEVAVPAAQAIGIAGGEGQLAGLLSALASGSDELKKASATAIGHILGRMSSCPDSAAMGLMAAMDAATDVQLRMALAAAFGKAKITAQQKLQVLEKLARVAGSEG